MSELVSVLRNVILPAQCLQVADLIIERISVSVVNNKAIRDLAILVFPDDNRAQPPSIRRADFNPSSITAIFVSSNRNASQGEPVAGSVSFFKFSIWRKMKSFDAFVPRAMTFRKGICGAFPLTPFISDLMGVRYRPNGHVPPSRANFVAEAGGLSAVVPNLKLVAANFACLCDHALDIVNQALWFNRSGDLFVAPPSATPKQLDLEDT